MCLILNFSTAVVRGAAGEEKVYIPLDLAKQRIEQLTKEMHGMKTRHLEVINEIAQSYAKISEENRQSTRARSLLAHRLVSSEHRR